MRVAPGTDGGFPRYANMADAKQMWLVVNARSGSNGPATLAALEASCEEAGLHIARRINFPDDPLPTPDDLDAAGIGCLAVFTGDGTLNAAVTGLYGWGGEVLVLPGGTQNLFSKRLHGPQEAAVILGRIASGAYRRVRPLIARCEAGDALAGMLVGPGSAWANVREAMRDFNVTAMAQGASDAMTKSTEGGMVRCVAPDAGRAAGYPLIDFTPSHRGLQLDGYSAGDTGEVLQHSWAVLQGNFRDGPKERLGLFDEVTLENTAGDAIELTIDGETATLPARATFAVVSCEVDLLATDHGF